MHITLFTVGSRGDIEPYLALGRGLVAAGHTVRMSTHRRYEPEITELGMEFSPASGDPRELMEAEAGKRWLDSGRNPVRIMQRLLSFSGPLFHQYLRDCEAAIAGTDAVLFSVLAFPAYHLAEAARIPAIGAYLQPITRTREFPSLFTKRARSPLLNLWSHVAVEQITWQPVRRSVNRWRAELGLRPLPRYGLYRSIYESLPVLYGFSPAVVPPPSDWPQQVRVTGYWVDETSTQWRGADTLSRFLADGPAPVYIGFGSRPERHPERLADLVLAAVRQAGQRAILLTGWGGLTLTESHDDVLVVDEVPHDWLFPQMAAVVHHGGAGTTGTALRSGVPSIVVPSFADQFFWGERVEALGVGVNVPRRSLTLQTLLEAMVAMSDEDMRRASAELGARLRAENGVEGAIRELTSILDDWPRI